MTFQSRKHAGFLLPNVTQWKKVFFVRHGCCSTTIWPLLQMCFDAWFNNILIVIILHIHVVLCGVKWVVLHSFLTCHLHPFRAVTLVRRTKGEIRRGRSQPLRCNRQNWYGGTRGRETGGVSGEATPHRHTMTSHSAQTPHHHNVSLFSLPVFSLSTHTTCLLPAVVDWPVHAFAGLCPPVGSMSIS